jgi:uncharacterized repeat protein (TIGR03803 family)
MRRLGSALCIIILVGCSRMPATSSLPATSQPTTNGAKFHTSSGKFQTMFVFKTNHNGIIPAGGVLGVSGTLYGATNFGGDANKECYPGHGCGTVFSISTPGSESVLYRFAAGKDAARPYAGLIDVSGTLYGTTQIGGKSDKASNKGTVYAITPSGSETVLHAFDGKDGNDPRASLTSLNGTLYGTTYYGGSTETGTVFSITTSGAEHVLHSFTGGTDGALPLASLTAYNNILYGTTSSGGTNNAGTVFAISPGGSNYTVLYSFTGGADGAFPFAGLAELNGTLYGTTQQGGAHKTGTVFAITTSGSESVIHSFGGPKDGTKPYAGLTVVNGQLYGTTGYGGPGKQGTLFSITPSGSETVLHPFARGTGGRVPYASLNAVGGALYGTTLWGGRLPAGVGTIFEYSP